MKKFRLIYIALFLLMMANSAADNIRGAIIPSLKNFFSIQNTQIGWMLIINSGGYMLGTYFGGQLCARKGQKFVVQIGVLVSILSMVLMAFSKTFAFFLGATFIGSIGVAFMGIAINTLIPIVSGNKQALVMNLTHFCYGIGAMMTQKLSGIMVSGPFPWQVVFYYVMGFMMIALVYVTAIKFPQSKEVLEHHANEPLSREEKSIAVLFICLLGFYVAGEIQAITWMINYIKVAYSRPESYAATFSAFFFMSFSVGRLVGGFFVEKIGYLKSVQFAIIGAMLTFLLGWFLKQNGLALISLSGFFFSICFPTIVLSASVFYKAHSARLTGIVVTGATAINTVLSLAMGILNDSVGVYYALLLIPMSLMVSLFFLRILRRKIDVRTHSLNQVD